MANQIAKIEDDAIIGKELPEKDKANAGAGDVPYDYVELSRWAEGGIPRLQNREMCP